MKQETAFPEGFYWGAATASYQVEGGNENTDWAEAARAGKVPPAGKLADHYHLYKKDIYLAKELGHNAHRFSVEWARIEPEEGVFDADEIGHYRDVLRELRSHGIEPFITLWHFTLPLWFSESGGFERDDAPEIFARYCAKVTSELGELCTHFSTMNEPIVYASNGYLRGTWPPFKRFRLTDRVAITNSGKSYEPNPDRGIRPLFRYLRVRRLLARAHNAAYDAIKTAQPTTDVGIVKHVILFHANRNPINRVIAYLANWHWTHAFMKRVYRKCDSIGLNYYIHKKFGDIEVYPKTDMDWDVYPEGIYDVLMMLARYEKPLFVSEAGVADAEDAIRADYIRAQVAATRRAMENGADVRGHFYWSLLDNYEWALGTEKRFGLIEVDYETLLRKVRPSAYVYKKIIQNRGVV